jgi:hypothetical protein
MPLPCSVCSHPKRAEVDAALKSATPIRRLGIEFGLGRTALRNHLTSHSPEAHETRRRRAAAIGKTRRGTARKAISVSIRTPEDVFEQLEWQYGEMQGLAENARRTGDTLRLEKALVQLGVLIDKFAKALKVYDDGTTVNIDASARVMKLISGLSDSELLALVTAEAPPRALPVVPGAAELAE